MSVKNFRTFVIQSRNQILGGFDVDRLCPVFLGSIERTFLFIRQTQPFLKRFCERTSSNVSEKNVVRKSLAPKTEAKMAGSANNDAEEPISPIIRLISNNV